MTEPPVFSKIDADRILKRAGEIEGSEDAQPLTVEELRSIAREAGFGSHAVERAIAEAQRAAAAKKIRRPPVQRSGLIFVRFSTNRSIPVDVSSEQLMRAVRLLQPYREGPAQVKLEEHQITWQDRKGIRFTVTSTGALTELRVFVSRPTIRWGRWSGWVKAAADRLETLVLLVASEDLPGSELLAHLPEASAIEPGTG